MLGRARRSAKARCSAAIESVDPTPVIAIRRCPKPRSAAVLAVYRVRNARVVEQLVETAPSSWTVRLWALDHVAPELADHTVGTGPGLRSTLLNRLVAELPGSFEGYVVLSDDDYRFKTGSLATLVATAEAAELDLCQPAHSGRSYSSHKLTVRRLGTIARLTRFVEVGPTVCIAPRLYETVLPLDEADGMGWGTDASWSSLVDRGYKLGVVDWIRIRHLDRPGVDYDIRGLGDAFDQRIEAAGGRDVVFRSLESWRFWQREPRWCAGEAATSRRSPIRGA